MIARDLSPFLYNRQILAMRHPLVACQCQVILIQIPGFWCYLSCHLLLIWIFGWRPSGPAALQVLSPAMSLSTPSSVTTMFGIRGKVLLRSGTESVLSVVNFSLNWFSLFKVTFSKVTSGGFQRWVILVVLSL